MNAIKMLKEDHQKVKRLFKEFEATDEKSSEKKRSIAEKIFMELEIHTDIEEQIFYPAVYAVSEEAQDIVAEARQEHQIVKDLIVQLRDKDFESEQEECDAAFKVLMENVRHHIKEEENDMLPLAQKLLRNRLEELGTEMGERKKEAMAHVS